MRKPSPEQRFAQALSDYARDMKFKGVPTFEPNKPPWRNAANKLRDRFSKVFSNRPLAKVRNDVNR